MISGAKVGGVAPGAPRVQDVSKPVGRSPEISRYGSPVKADKSSEIELKALTKSVRPKMTSGVVKKHIEAIMTKKGHEIVKRLPKEVGDAVEDAVQTSLRSGVITKAESDGMRYAIGSEMLKRS